MERKKGKNGSSGMRYIEAFFFLLLFCVFAYIIIKDLAITPDLSAQANLYS